MKTNALFAVISALGIASASAQYSIDWYSVDGGGGTSSGGAYTLSGTIGQPDAGTMAGGGYTLSGGFWSVVALQTPGAPLLTVTRMGVDVVVSWPTADAAGFVLEEVSALTGNPVPWLGPSPLVKTTNGNVISVTVPAPVGMKYFRLRKP
jgi:hypothetical protein